MFYKKVVLKVSQNSRWPRHRSFPVSFEKFSRASHFAELPRVVASIRKSLINEFKVQFTITQKPFIHLLWNWLGKISFILLKDTHRENIPLCKTEALSKSINMYILAIGVLNQLFIRDSYTQIKFSKQETVSDKSPFFLIGPFLLPTQFVLTLAFDMAVLYGNAALSFVAVWTKKTVLQFLRKVLVFEKTCFKLTYWKRSKSAVIVT